MAAVAYTGLVKAVQHGSLIFLIILDIHLQKQAIIWDDSKEFKRTAWTIFPLCTDDEPSATAWRWKKILNIYLFKIQIQIIILLFFKKGPLCRIQRIATNLTASPLPLPFQACIWTYGGCQVPIAHFQNLHSHLLLFLILNATHHIKSGKLHFEWFELCVSNSWYNKLHLISLLL